MAKQKKRVKKVKKADGASKRPTKASRARVKAHKPKAKAPPTSPRKKQAGNPGFAGYEYQIEATIWVALDLMLAKSATSEIMIEPPSDEDIEASVENPDDATLGLTVPSGRVHYMIQVKTKSGSPWSSGEIADVLTGKNDTPSRGRARPLDLLKAERRRRYIFITNEALSASLRPHQGKGLFDTPEATALPPNAKRGFTSEQQAELAKRILLCSGITDELLDSRIERLLSLHGHVPRGRQADSLIELRNAVRERISGKVSSTWTRGDVTTLLAKYGGSVAPTRAMDRYIEPQSYAEIRRMLETSNAVLIAGPSGTGKTLTADIIENELRQGPNAFEVIGEEHGPHFVRKHLTQPTPILFHLRDPWGGNRLTPGADRWSGELPKLLSGAGPDKIFLITSRSDVLQSAGDELVKELAPYTVLIEIEDYGPARLEKIYDGIAGHLKGPAQTLAKKHRQDALDALKRPYEIDRFLAALTREDPQKPRKIGDILADSQIDAISGVIAKQIAPLGNDGVTSSAVVWSLLTARGTVSRGVFPRLVQRMQVLDQSAQPDVDGLIDFLVAGRNLRDDEAISFSHPKVEDGLRMAFSKNAVVAGRMLSLVVDALVTFDGGEGDWGAETGLGVLRSSSKLKDTQVSLRVGTHSALDRFLSRRALESDRRIDFSQALTDLARFGSTDHALSRLARILIDGGPPQTQIFGFDSWEAPTVSDEEIATLRGNSHTAAIIERFIREVLPFAHRSYDDSVAALLLKLAPNLREAFWDSLDIIADPGGPHENIKAIVAGACAGGGDDFDLAITRFALSEQKADTWLEAYFATDGLKAEEHEVDAVAADHILEEPQEHYYNSEAGMKAVVALRRQQEGLSWIAGHAYRQLLIEAAASLLNHSSRPPSSAELRVLIDAAQPDKRTSIWRAARRHWQHDLVDLLDAEIKRSGMTSGLRRELIESAAGASDPPGDPLKVVIPVALEVSDERRLEMVFDLFRTSLDGDSGNAGKAARLARARGLTDALPDPMRELGHLLISLAGGEEISGAANSLSEAAKSALASLLPTLAPDVAGPLLCAAAAVGIDPSAAARRLLATDDGEDGAAAVQALTIYGQESIRAIVREALGHKRYPVRRASLRYLVQLNDPQDRERLLSVAYDRSADVRMAWARLMQEHKWPDAASGLATLLEDQRDFSSDPGHLLGPSWSEYKVARAAAHALESYDDVSKDVLDALIQVAVKSNRDPFVRCAAISALSDKTDARISKLFNAALGSKGLKGAHEYRPLAQSAAWGMFDRAVAKKDIEFSTQTLDMAAQGPPAISGPLLMGVGVVGGSQLGELVARLGEVKHAQRLELLKIAAILSGTAAGLELTRHEQVLVKLQTDTPIDAIDPKERVDVESWSRGLAADGIQAFTAWVANAFFKLPISHEAGDMRGYDLPERISVMNLRALSSAREEAFGPDDGT